MTRQRGQCAVCGFSSALRQDGRVYRHFAGFTAALDGDPICKGWGKPPKATVQVTTSLPSRD